MHSLTDVLRAVCWRSVTFDFELRAIHVPGSLIGIPDAISRLHETGQPERLARLLSYWHHGRPPPATIAAHMSWPSYHFLCQQVSAKKLETALQAEVARYRGETFADNTKGTYTSHRNSFLRFCTELCVPPVPAKEKTIAMYAACLARRLRPASVRQFLNIVRVMHLEAGLSNPVER